MSTGSEAASRKEKTPTMHVVGLVRTVTGQIQPVTTLDRHPDLARGLGIFFDCYSIAEMTERDILAKLKGVSQDEAGHLLWTHRSQKARIRLIREALSGTLSGRILSKASELLPEIEWLIEERNKYAHSQFSTREDEPQGAVYRRVYFTDGTYNAAWELFSREKLNTDIARSRKIIVELWDFLREEGPYF